MDQETLWREYAALSDEARRQVDEFIVRLSSRQAARKELMRIESDPFVGLWRDRNYLTDGQGSVRSLRECEWNQTGS
jgi:hypothetical protein